MMIVSNDKDGLSLYKVFENNSIALSLYRN